MSLRLFELQAPQTSFANGVVQNGQTRKRLLESILGECRGREGRIGFRSSLCWICCLNCWIYVGHTRHWCSCQRYCGGNLLDTSAVGGSPSKTSKTTTTSCWEPI